MSFNNDFKPFAIAAGANVLSPSTWAADPALSVGFQVGIASSTKANTAIRQASFVSAMIAQFTADNGPGNVADNGNLSALETQFEAALIQYLSSFYQKILLTSTTFYIDQGIGSDTLYDVTSDTISGAHGPWATLTHALTVMATLNLNGNTATIQLANPGTYSGLLNIRAPSSGTLMIRGDPSSQSSYIISGTPGGVQGVVTVNSGSVELTGITVENISGPALSWGIEASNSSVTLTNVTVAGATSSFANVLAEVGGSITLGSGIIFSGSTNSAACAQHGGVINQSGSGPTVSGSPAYATGAMSANSLGVYAVAATGVTAWSGAATGHRYSAVLNSVINTNGGGASFFPGSVAGTTATGGQYI